MYIMCSLLFCLAISVLTNDKLRITATSNSISVSWSSSPPYPGKYQLSCVCSLLCEEIPTTNIVTNHTPQATSAFVTGLLPGSKCNLNLAEYSQDMGEDKVTKIASADAETAYKGEQN